jgi:hypothetical protein
MVTKPTSTRAESDSADLAIPSQKTLIGLIYYIAANYRSAVTQWIGVLIFAGIFIGGATVILKYTAPIISDLKETSHNMREAIQDLHEFRATLRAEATRKNP